MPDRCPRGHVLDETNRYEEPAPGPGGMVRVRCRTCRREQRTAQRRRAGARPVGELDLVTLVGRQRPTPGDITRAVELWVNGSGGDACRQAGVQVAEISRLVGCNPTTARGWLRGGSPQRRYQNRATALLLAIGTLQAEQPPGPTAGTGDQVMLIGGRPDRDGPWHHTPPHSGHQPRINENWYASGNPTGPRWFDWWPCHGFVASLPESKRLLAAHSYLNDPRTHEYATACHGYPGWKNDCPNCTGVQPTTAAWAIHMADLYDGNGCTPDNCPATTDERTPPPKTSTATPQPPQNRHHADAHPTETTQ